MESGPPLQSCRSDRPFFGLQFEAEKQTVKRLSAPGLRYLDGFSPRPLIPVLWKSSGCGGSFPDREEESVSKCFRYTSVDLPSLLQADIQHDCVHGICVCRVLKQHPRIAPVWNHDFPAHRSDVSLLLTEIKAGQFLDTSFDLIHRQVWQI